MPASNPTEVLEAIYRESERKAGEAGVPITELAASDREILDIIFANAESSKAVLTVFVTSSLYKLLHPKQDIRCHQSSIQGGYSGRSFDTQYVTPFLKGKSLPAMAESGWLTRSLEQNTSYSLSYSGSIRPRELKEAFLRSLDKIQNGASCETYLDYIFQNLILARNRNSIILARPSNLPIDAIVEKLDRHFNATYTSSGASRLPVLAVYAIYECIMDEISRFEGKSLVPIESHTSADSRSGAIGDIEVRDSSGEPFEGLEIKHGIKVTLQMVKDAYAKINHTPTKRYYILSTAGIESTDLDTIKAEIERIKNIHGCNIIANGVIDTIKYYLRLLNDPAKFTAKYVARLELDQALKFEHKEMWNTIVG